jgi:aminoglycoside 6'-N-acetyltransferase
LTTVRRATPDDVDLLAAWHADPEISRYWDDETYTRDELLERLRRPDVQSFIVEERARPVGFLQAWREGDQGGVDMFLVPAARGRGLGPDAARAFVLQLLDGEGWTSVTTDPYLWNQAAVRAWRRAGFRDVEVREPDEWHRDRWLLMDFERS